MGVDADVVGSAGSDDILGSYAVGPGALDTDSDLLPVPEDAWGYPAGCPVAFNFRPSPPGRGDVDFQVGAVRSLQMDRSTRKLIFLVEQRGRNNKNIKFVRIIRDNNIGYAVGCPVTIRMAGQSVGTDGEIMFAMPTFGSHDKIESILYTAVLLLDGNKRRIVSNVPAELVKYRQVVEGGGINSAPIEENQSVEETQPISKPRSKSVAPKPSEAKIKKRKMESFNSRSGDSDQESFDSSSGDSDQESSGDYKELKVGSRVNVLFNGSEWQATILGDKVKHGELGLMVHYKGSKANSKDWVRVDRVVSVVPTGSMGAKKQI